MTTEVAYAPVSVTILHECTGLSFTTTTLPAISFTIGSAAVVQSLTSAITVVGTPPTGATCFTYSLVEDVSPYTTALAKYYITTPGSSLPTSLTIGPVNNGEIGTLPNRPETFRFKAVVNIATATPVYSTISLTLIHECDTATLT